MGGVLKFRVMLRYVMLGTVTSQTSKNTTFAKLPLSYPQATSMM